MTNAQKKGLAEIMFIDHGKTLKRIHEELKVSLRTLGVWKKEGKWEERREYLNSAPSRIRQKLMEEMELVIAGKDPTFSSDHVSKINKALTDFTKMDKNPSVIYSILIRLDNYVARNHPQLIEDITKVHREFLTESIEQAS